jgi:hypothetical protein
MPYIQPDFSEYKVSDNEKFRAKLRNSKYAQFNYFVNNARFIEESKYIIINVDRGCEYNLMKYYLDVFDKEEAEHRDVHSENLSPEEEEEYEELRLEKIEENKKLLCLSSDEIGILRSFSKTLSEGDVGTEIKNIEAVKTRLDSAQNDAADEVNKKAKATKSIGLLAGVFIVILLL